MNEAQFTPKEIRNRLASQGTVRVTFTKKNGDERLMVCTTNPLQIPWEHQPKNADANQQLPENQIRVYDLEAEGWRSFLAERVLHLD